MRKTGFSLIVLMIVSIIAGISTGCGNEAAKEKARQDSIARADSIAAVRAREDSIRRDSLMAVQITEEFANPLTYKFGKRKEVGHMDREGLSITIPVTVTNNTSIPLAGSDYAICYVSHYRTCSDGSEPDNLSSDKIDGKDLQPGETVQLFIKNSDCDDITDLAVKFYPTAEEFESRFREYAATKQLPDTVALAGGIGAR